MISRRKKGYWMASIALLCAAEMAAFVGCGKNLGQVFFHPSVDQRFTESVSGSLSAPTAMTPADPSNFSFAVFGDVQIRSENKTLLTRLKQDIASNGIAFCVILGDLTENGNTDEFSKVKAALNDLGVPYYATIGNHDLFQDPAVGGWNSWKATFGPATYSVTIANAVRILLFDTSSGEIGTQQFNWLQSQLQASTAAPYTIVGSHYAVHDGITPTIWRLESVEERYKLVSMLDRYGVYAYVGGHVHGYRSGEAGSVKHFTVGSMYPYELDYGAHGYLLFTYQAGQMSWKRVEWADTP